MSPYDTRLLLNGKRRSLADLDSLCRPKAKRRKLWDPIEYENSKINEEATFSLTAVDIPNALPSIILKPPVTPALRERRFKEASKQICRQEDLYESKYGSVDIPESPGLLKSMEVQNSYNFPSNSCRITSKTSLDKEMQEFLSCKFDALNVRLPYTDRIPERERPSRTTRRRCHAYDTSNLPQKI